MLGKGPLQLIHAEIKEKKWAAAWAKLEDHFVPKQGAWQTGASVENGLKTLVYEPTKYTLSQYMQVIVDGSAIFAALCPGSSLSE